MALMFGKNKRILSLRANGNKYIGGFKAGKPHGIGIYIDMEERTKRHGEWIDGKRVSWLSSAEEIDTSGSPVKSMTYQSKLHMS